MLWNSLWEFPFHRKKLDPRLSDKVVAALKPIDPERLQRQRAAAELDQICHDSSNDGAKLKAVCGKTKCMEDAWSLRTRADDRELVGHHALYSSPAAYNRDVLQRRKKRRNGLGADPKFFEIDHRPLLLHILIEAIPQTLSPSLVGPGFPRGSRGPQVVTRPPADFRLGDTYPGRRCGYGL